MKSILKILAVACSFFLHGCFFIIEDAAEDAADAAEDIGSGIGGAIACSLVTFGGNKALDDLNSLEKKFGGYSEGDSIPFVSSKGDSFNLVVKKDTMFYASRSGYVKYKDSLDACDFIGSTGESSAVVAFRLRQLKLESDDKKVQMEFVLNDKKNHRWIYDYPRGCQKGCRYDTLYSLVDSVSTVEFKLGGETCVNIYERRFKGDADSNVVLPELMPVISHNQIPLVESLGCDLKRLVMSKKGALLQLKYKDGSYIRKQDYIEADSSVKAD